MSDLDHVRDSEQCDEHDDYSDTGQQSTRPSRPECSQGQAAGSGDLIEYQSGDQPTRQREEDIDPHPAGAEHAAVETHDGQHRQRP